MRSRTILTAAIAVLILAAALEIRDIAGWFNLALPRLPMPYGRSSIDNLAAVLLAVLGALVLARKSRWALGKNLGLLSAGWRGPIVTLLATAPCWIGLTVQGHIAADFTARDLLFTALLFPLAEEIVFRGFGFVFVRKQLGWPIATAVLIQATAFGTVHWLGSGGGTGMALVVFAITGLGGVIFAILDAIDGYSIWSGLVFHVSLNAAWTVFTVPDGIVFGLDGNILRIASAVLAIGFLYVVRRRTR